MKVGEVSLTLRGHSVSARQSGFYIDEWNLMLDAGICSPYSPVYICISHGHSDHSYELPMLVTGTTKHSTVFVPLGTQTLFDNLLRSKHDLSNDIIGSDDYHVDNDNCHGGNCNNSVEQHNDVGDKGHDDEDHGNHSEYQTPVTLVPVSGEGVTVDMVGINSHKVVMRTFTTYHTVRSVGYAYFHVKSRLKAQYRDVPKDQMKRVALEVKGQGLTMSEQYQVPLFVYTGDTSPHVFDQPLFTDNVFPYIITECTFFEQLEPELPPDTVTNRANMHGHTSWCLLLPYITRMTNTTFILTHFSARYKLQDVINFISQTGITNVIVWDN